MRLELIAADAESARAAVADRARFGTLLDAKVPKEWPPELFAEDEAKFADRLEAARELDEVGWHHWYILKVGPKARTLVGTIGFGGPPSTAGEVMMGYSVLGAFQRKGYATEAVGALIDWAFEDPRTRAILAQTYERLPASVKVLERNGLTIEKRGPEEGLLTFALRRPV
jgi:RimJ/RimL family protein N-acetyltransferase